MRITEFAKTHGVPTDTLRYYDKLGLLQPSRTGATRTYTESDGARLGIIRHLQSIGFTLRDIMDLLALDERMDTALAMGGTDPTALTECVGIVSGLQERLAVQREAIDKALTRLDRMMMKLRWVEAGNPIGGFDDEAV